MSVWQVFCGRAYAWRNVSLMGSSTYDGYCGAAGRPLCLRSQGGDGGGVGGGAIWDVLASQRKSVYLTLRSGNFQMLRWGLGWRVKTWTSSRSDEVPTQGVRRSRPSRPTKKTKWARRKRDSQGALHMTRSFNGNAETSTGEREGARQPGGRGGLSHTCIRRQWSRRHSKSTPRGSRPICPSEATGIQASGPRSLPRAARTQSFRCGGGESCGLGALCSRKQ